MAIEIYHYYVERLKPLNLDIFKVRRLNSDLNYCYKIIFGLVRLNSDEFFEMATSHTRGHPFKLYKWSSTSTNSSFLDENNKSLKEVSESTDFS